MIYIATLWWLPVPADSVPYEEREPWRRRVVRAEAPNPMTFAQIARETFAADALLTEMTNISVSRFQS